MSDILINAEQNTAEKGDARVPEPGVATKPERDAPAAATGVLPLYRAIERLQIGIVITDLDGTVHYVNGAVSESHG